MKRNQITSTALTIVMLALFGLVLVGCESNTTNNLAGPDDGASAHQMSQLSLEKKGRGNPDKNGHSSSAYPMSAEYRVTFWSSKGYYSGGQFSLSNESSFRMASNSLVPPPGTTWGVPVTLTWSADIDTVAGEIVYTFGPHGSQFKRGAEIWLSWRDLGSPKANLYYIDDYGNYLRQQPESIDFHGQKLKITIWHFSRYAISAD